MDFVRYLPNLPAGSRHRKRGGWDRRSMCRGWCSGRGAGPARRTGASRRASPLLVSDRGLEAAGLVARVSPDGDGFLDVPENPTAAGVDAATRRIAAAVATPSLRSAADRYSTPRSSSPRLRAPATANRSSVATIASPRSLRSSRSRRRSARAATVRRSPRSTASPRSGRWNTRSPDGPPRRASSIPILPARCRPV